MLKTKGKQEIRLDSLDLDWEQKTGNLEDKTWIVNARSTLNLDLDLLQITSTRSINW